MSILAKIKREAGYILRGIFGFFINNIERAPRLPQNIKKVIFGTSTMGRALEYCRWGEGGTKILFLAAIHGNEVGTVKLLYKLIDFLTSGEQNLKNKFTLFFIPCLNIDGYHLAIRNPEYLNGGNIGRFNTNKVDLNRNFDTPGFQKYAVYSFGKNYQEKMPVYAGEYGNSEPETKALVELIKNEDIKTVFSFHNAGREIMGNRLNKSQELIKIFSEKSGFRLVNDEEWKSLNQTGTLKEWCEINNIIYLEPEGTTRWGNDWSNQKDAIISTIQAI